MPDVTVTFDQPLDPGFSANANWIGRTALPFQQEILPVGFPAIAGRTVTFPALLGAPAFGFRAITYFAAPADVRNRFLQPAPGFVDFPMT